MSEQARHEPTARLSMLRVLTWLLPPSPLREDLRAADASRRRTAEIYKRINRAPRPPANRADAGRI